MTERRRHSLERYHPPRRPGADEPHSESADVERDLNVGFDSLNMDEGQGREFGRGRGQHRWDSGRQFQRGRGGGGGRGGWGRGRGRGWNRGDSDAYYEGHDNRNSMQGNHGQYDEYEEEPSNYDLREELNHGHYDLRNELNQRNLPRQNEASGYDLRDELNHKRATEEEHRNRQHESRGQGQDRRGLEKNGNR